MDSILAFDLWVMRLVNVHMEHPILDQFWLLITSLHKNAVFTFVVLPACILWCLYKYRLRALKPLAMVALVVGITDVTVYRGIKQNFHRQRPFQNSEVSTWVRKVGEAHGPSFPSNHAANVFAGALVLSVFFPRKRYYFYTFAALVAFSRVALGVHYPTDALAGALIGTLIATLIVLPLRKYAPIWDIQSGHISGSTRRLEDR